MADYAQEFRLDLALAALAALKDHMRPGPGREMLSDDCAACVYWISGWGNAGGGSCARVRDAVYKSFGPSVVRHDGRCRCARRNRP